MNFFEKSSKRQSWAKFIYLDGDIIVRQSLKELWSTDITGLAIAAVPDKKEKQICYGNKEFRLGYPPYLGFFNAGASKRITICPYSTLFLK